MTLNSQSTLASIVPPHCTSTSISDVLRPTRHLLDLPVPLLAVTKPSMNVSEWTTLTQQLQHQSVASISNSVSSSLSNQIAQARSQVLLSLIQRHHVPESLQATPQVATRLVTVTRKNKRFFLFIKVLLRYVYRSGNIGLHTLAKTIIADCTRRSRNGNLGGIPIQQAVEIRLKCALGMELWTNAQNCFELLCERKKTEILARRSSLR